MPRRRWSTWASLGVLLVLVAGAAIWSSSTSPTPTSKRAVRPGPTPTTPGAYSWALVIDRFVLVPITAAERAGCQRAADTLRSPVPCPGLIPDPIASADNRRLCPVEGETACSRPSVGVTPPYFIWNQYSFQVPKNYIGVPGQTAVNGRPLGHFIIYAGRNLNTSRRYRGPVKPVPSYCRGVHTPHVMKVHGSVARLYECADHSNGSSVELDVGHELLVWRQSGVTCEVSLHGHSRLNQLLDLVVAYRSHMVFPEH